MGHPFYQLVYNNDDVLVALCPDGVFNVSDNTLQISNHFQFMTFGKAYNIAISNNKRCYSWGIGNRGEIGHGISKKCLQAPTPIAINCNFDIISSGSNHTLAIDLNGKVYGWGRNNCGQLGLFNKSREMIKSVGNEMSFNPRMLPLTIKRPVASVSCGHDFSILLTRSNDFIS
jgi:E3 ubiquitin-protein ligase HERC4